MIWIQPDTADHDSRIAWARLHGIDPFEVPLDSDIGIDYEAHQIVHQRILRGADGRMQRDDDGWFVTETVTIQLEAGPAPWPGKDDA